jgi:hexulose-6-phosphate isomerase
MNNILALNYWVMGGFDARLDAYSAIEKAKSYGLDGVELTFAEVIKEEITDEEIVKLREFAEKKKIKLKTMATGFYWGTSLSSEDESERNKAIAFTEKYLTVASKLGVETILILPGWVEVPWEPALPVVPYNVAWENSINSLKALAPIAEKLKVNIALENVWNNFLLSPVEMKFFLDTIGSDFIGSYLDVGNVVRVGIPEQWIKILESRIKAVHIKNFKREDACGGLHGFGENILEGDINFDNIKNALAEINYTGPITAEMIPFSRLPELKLPDEQLAEITAKRLIKLFR